MLMGVILQTAVLACWYPRCDQKVERTTNGCVVLPYSPEHKCPFCGNDLVAIRYTISDQPPFLFTRCGCNAVIYMKPRNSGLLLESGSANSK
jgi:hypothetical protein